jgi:hypothetical protein
VPRSRTGTLVYKRATGWNARVSMPVMNDDGTATEGRRWGPLDTHDEDLAKRKLAKIVGMLERGELVAEALKREVAAVSTSGEEKLSWVTARNAAKVVQAPDEERLLDEHAMKRLGPMRITQVRTHDVNAVLLAAFP